MSTAMAVRLIIGLLVGGVLAWSIWDQSSSEQVPQPESDSDKTPRFRPSTGSYMLPLLPVIYLAGGMIAHNAQLAAQLMLGLLLHVFLLIGVYYVLLLALMPLLRRHFSARVCALLWLLPDWMYLIGNLNLKFPTDSPAIVLHASGTLVYTLFAVWAAGAVGVFSWKILSHLRFRQQILKNAEPVTDAQTLAIWEKELTYTRIKSRKWKLVRTDVLSTPLSIGLFARSTCVVLPHRNYSPEELSLILRHEIIHISRGDPASKCFMAFCTAMCWFNPLMWVAMRKSADDFELSCDESVLLGESQNVRRQYAELLLNTAGDERGFTTCLSATASALRYRLKNIITPGRKFSGALLAWGIFLAMIMNSGFVTLAYDAQPGAQRIFDGQALTDVRIYDISLWGGSSSTDGRCSDPPALKAYLASLELEMYTERLDTYADGGQRELFLLLETPKGRLRVTLQNRAAIVTRMWWDGDSDFYKDSYYLKTPVDWAYLDTLVTASPGS